MGLPKYDFPIVDSEGNIVPLAEVTVRRESDNSLATLYSDKEGSTVLSSVGVFQADSNGNASFFAAPDTYKVYFTNGTVSRTYRYQTLHPMNGLITDATTSRTLSIADAGNYLRFTSDSAISVTVPADSEESFPVGSEMQIRQAGGGIITLTASPGVTLNDPFGGLAQTEGQGHFLSLRKVGNNEWDIVDNRIALDPDSPATTAAVALLTDVKVRQLSDKVYLFVAGDSVASDNHLIFKRNSSLDDPLKAGLDAEMSAGTLIVYDALGSAFSEVKVTISPRSRSSGKQSGRNVHIYEWGSPFGGNDWCFVRTPDGYDPQGEPHPLLILNHGNGWIMDGTEAMANFSSKTQFGVDTQNSGTYLDDTRSDYVEYSSPMIEAFLAEGYVVCGAQNDGQNYGVGQAGYGNRETRQNIKLFFDHIQANYNVQPWCHMIGASNGCIATLNAAMIMGSERIRSITLLYPLINLHAAWSSTYTSAVETAYSPFSTSGAFSSFLEQTDGHDPMVAFTDFSILAADSTEAVYANANFYRLSQDSGTKDLTWVRENRLVDSAIASDIGISLSSLTIYRRSIFPWPRIRCHWSPDDTAVPQEYHWQAFEKLLTRGNHVTFSEEVLGEHGDYRHFEGLDGSGVSRIIAWTQI